jgi:hypothetical protein
LTALANSKSLFGISTGPGHWYEFNEFHGPWALDLSVKRTQEKKKKLVQTTKCSNFNQCWMGGTHKPKSVASADLTLLMQYRLLASKHALTCYRFLQEQPDEISKFLPILEGVGDISRDC